MLGVNVFLKIINKEIKADIVHDDSHCLAFKDINPQAPTHIIIIPKKVIRTHAEISPADRDLLGHLHIVAAEVAQKQGLIDGYRLVINCDKQGGQTVPHLHMHLLGGRDLNWPPG